LERITDAFAWPVHDPAWPAKLLTIGLILLVPVAGVINGLGWMLAGLDRLRAGQSDLPPAGFNYMGRGLRLFAVEVVYGAAIAAVTALVYVPAVLILVHEGRGSAAPALLSAGLLLSLLTISIVTLGSLALNFALPAVVLAVDRDGVAGGLRVVAIARRARRSASSTLIAGLMLIAAGFIGSLGVVACGVGLVFSTAYSLAMQAWIIRSYELGATHTRTA
jgi:hypothetical protein